ncbi:MAG TPA: lamin tail domain-containing protein, partial [Candidatus Paceibacterota bacterium]|nr:lamin tail domain-containing protein [Candidatus Paceibacterota bacterium]
MILAGIGRANCRADASLVFNEVMYHPATEEPLMEWVELHNQMAVDLDISNWSLDGGIGFVFGPNTVVRGGGYLVVAVSPATLVARTGLTNVFGPFTNRLSNSGERLLLRNNNGRVVSELNYGVGGDWPVAPDGSGVSLAKLDETLASKPARNWTWSAQMGGTPGAKNFPIAPALSPIAFNEVPAATNTDFWLELINWGSNTVSLSGYVIVHDGTTNAEYVFPSSTSIPATNWLALTPSTLGFAPRSGDKLFLLPPARDRVVDAVEVKDTPRARSPDSTGEWYRPATPTPGQANAFAFHDEVVINEIMYHHQRPAATNDLPPPPSDEEWLELYNRSTNAVDLSGWSLAGGIAYQFPPGRTLGPGSFLVVARDSQTLSWLYPAIDIVGNYTGQLANDGDTIVLKDAAGNPADRVQYYTSGRWPLYADGGGSSLELRDPWADNSKAEAWAASDEAPRAEWRSYSYQAVAQTRWFEPSQWKDFIVGLLEAGECFLDDVSVVEIQGANRTPRLVNGNFENGATGWRFLGNHARSRVITDPDNPSNHLLHLVATGPQEHMHNHVESTLNDGGITDGRTYEIAFRAKWLAGGKLLNTRLFFNRVARTTTLAAPQLNGTPGAPNSRYETNIGPTFLSFQHQPVIPAAGQPVTVSVTAQDPQGVSACELWWSINSGPFSHVTMTAKGGGRFEGTIPGNTAGKIIQFYVTATDSLGATAAFPAAGPDSGALFMVADGQARPTLGHNFRLIFTPANWALLRAVTNLMSNATLPCTLIYNEQRPYYDIRALLKGSQSGRPNDPRPSFNVKFQPDDRFRGVHPVLLLDSSGPPGTVNQQQEILAHHMLLHAGGIPGMQPDLGWLIPPFQTNTGPAFVIPRHEDEFIETAFENGGDGTEWSFEMIYTPTTTNSAGYKLPNPQILLGVDLQDLGDDKEAYRYNYILKYHRGADNFLPVMTLAKTMELPGGPLLDAQAHLLMDLNEWLRTLAFVSLCGESDWYSFSNPHNFNLYQRPGDGRLVMLPWDIEHLYLRSSTAPLLGTAAPYWADLAKLPGNKRRLYGHALDMIQSTFNTAYMTYWANHYSRFAPGQDFTDLLPDIQARATAVLAEINAAGGNAPFVIFGTNYLESSNSIVTLSGTAPVQVHSLRINGVEYPVTWTTLSNWTVKVAVSAPTTPLYIAGYDLWGNALTNFSGSVTVRFTGTSPSPVGKVIISEILCQPLIPGAAWVELHNASASTFDLSGWRLDGLGYTFPAGTLLTNGQFLVLAKEGNAFLSLYGTNVTPFGLFPGNLQTNGETLTLLMPGSLPGSEVVVDRVRYSALPPWPVPVPGLSLQVIDVAQDNSRLANWGVGTPTPGRSNALAQALPTFPNLWINELQPENLTGITNSAGQRTAWVEIYNAGSNAVSLEGLFLT